jgi:hypothetical protein
MRRCAAARTGSLIDDKAQRGKEARMPSKQDEPDPEVEFLRTFVSERARLQAFASLTG